MKSRVQDKIEAISLRMQGYSYAQIQEKLGVSKSLLSGWFKYIVLNQNQQQTLHQNLTQRSKKGVANAVLVNRRKREQRETSAKEKSDSIYETHKEDKLFVAGLCLYWAEGSKRSSAAQFVNSDPKMIIFMLYWIKKYLGITNNQLYVRLATHKDFEKEKYELFWSNLTKIPLEQFKKTSYKPNRHGIHKKNPDYKGCLRIELPGGMETLRIVRYLYESFISDSEVLYSSVLMRP